MESVPCFDLSSGLTKQLGWHEKWGGHKWTTGSEERVRAEHIKLLGILHTLCHEISLESMAERAGGGPPLVPSIPTVPSHLLVLSSQLRRV